MEALYARGGAGRRAARRARARASAAATALRLRERASASAVGASRRGSRALASLAARADSCARARSASAAVHGCARGRSAMQSTGQGGRHRAQPVHRPASTVCMSLAAPTIASTGQAAMHSVQPMHARSSIRASAKPSVRSPFTTPFYRPAPGRGARVLFSASATSRGSEPCSRPGRETSPRAAPGASSWSTDTASRRCADRPFGS